MVEGVGVLGLLRRTTCGLPAYSVRVHGSTVVGFQLRVSKGFWVNLGFNQGFGSGVIARGWPREGH